MRHNPRTRQIGQHVYSYDTAERFLAGRQEKKLANNTVIYRGDDGSIGVRLHRTTVVRYFRNGDVMLDSGGYRTVTTKQRINQLLPGMIGLSQRDYNWTVENRYLGTKEPFRDGMIVRGPSAHDKPYASNPGKYENTVEELLGAMDPDQQIGSVQDDGWYGLISGLTKDEAEEQANFLGIDLDPDDVEEFTWPINAIIHEDGQGFFYCETYQLNRDVMQAWRKLEREVDRDG